MNTFSIQFSPFSLPSCARWHLSPSPPLAASLKGEERWPVPSSLSRAGFAGGGSVGSGLVLVCPAHSSSSLQEAQIPDPALPLFLLLHGWIRADWSLPRALTLWWNLLVQQALGAISVRTSYEACIRGHGASYTAICWEALNASHSRSLPQN